MTATTVIMTTPILRDAALRFAALQRHRVAALAALYTALDLSQDEFSDGVDAIREELRYNNPN